MDHSFPMNKDRYAIESQIRECFGRCAYSHKTHEQMADIFSTSLWRTKWAQILLSAFTAGGAVGTLFDETGTVFPYATAALAIFTLIVNSYAKDLDPGALAQKHREVASDIWNVREAYLSLLSDVGDESIAVDTLRKRRDDLQSQLHKIYRAAPHTNGDAYVRAQERLQKKEDLTFSDAEIDAFLPTSLKRASITKVD